MTTKGLTVAELIEFLKTQPQTMRVAVETYSELCLVEAEEITHQSACKARTDGWIHLLRDDAEFETYLVFPGN